MKHKRNKKAFKPDNPKAKGNSNYARKRAFLITHGGNGFDYPHKPWK